MIDDIMPGDLLEFVWKPDNEFVSLFNLDTDKLIHITRDKLAPTICMYVGTNPKSRYQKDAYIVLLSVNSEPVYVSACSRDRLHLGFFGRTVNLKKII